MGYTYICKYCEYTVKYKELLKSKKCPNLSCKRNGLELFKDLKTRIDDAILEQILSQENPVYQSIGIGLNNGVFYIGIKLFKEGEYYDAVVCSDKKLYVDWKKINEIKEKFKLNYRFSFFSEVVDYSWGNTGEFGIKAWLYDNKEITIKETYEDVLKLVKWKYWNKDENVYKHHALSIISGYFLPIFEAKGRELIYGESGFGKTRLSKIYQLLAFNPVMSGDISDSSFFRIIESTKATLIIDNFDDVDIEKKNRILHMYNIGYLKRQKAIRSEGKNFKPTGFDIFSSLILNTRTNLDEVAENRSNITRNFKTDKNEYEKLEDKDMIWKQTRDKLYYSTLSNWKEIDQIYSTLKEDRLISRDLERVIANLVIAKSIDEKLYEEMVEFYLKDNERRKIKDFKDDWIYRAFEFIVSKMKENNTQEIELFVKDIVDKLANDLWIATIDKNFDRKKHGLAIRLGSAFKNSTLFDVRVLDGCPLYKFTRDGIITFCKAKDYGDEIIKDIKQDII